jgi:hypothetical protein
MECMRRVLVDVTFAVNSLKPMLSGVIAVI